MKTIAQQLQIKKFPFSIKDSNGKEIYREESNGGWVRHEYNSSNREIYREESDGHWVRREYDSSNREIYLENSAGNWIKREYDSAGKEIYYESSFGTLYDNRPKTEIQKAIDLLTKEGLLVDGKILKQ